MNSHPKLPMLLVALVALGLVSACSQDSGGSNDSQGGVRVVLTAGTATTATASTGAASTGSTTTGATGVSSTTFGENHDDGDILSKLQHVNVTFSSLLARNLDGDLVDLAIDLPRTVDLMGLMNGQQVTLPTGTLPPGMYDQIVVVITNVEFEFIDGFKVTLTPPGGGWTRIVPVETFEVIEGETTTIQLRFRPWQAFREFDGEFQFFPDFDCERD